MVKKATSNILKIIGFFSITIGGAAIAFGPSAELKIIGGLLVTVGSGLASLS